MTVLMVATVVVIGLLVGFELAVAVFVNPMLDRLPAPVGLAGRTHGGRVLGRVMPFWYAGATVLGLAWLVLGLLLGAGVGVVPVGAAAALLVVTIVLSVVLLVPVNDRVRTWTENDAPADWRDQLGRWDRLHLLRTVLLVAAFVLAAVGLAGA